jgi:hypothetical protein
MMDRVHGEAEADDDVLVCERNGTKMWGANFADEEPPVYEQVFPAEEPPAYEEMSD